jgi:hypothetical protein
MEAGDPSADMLAEPPRRDVERLVFLGRERL